MIITAPLRSSVVNILAPRSAAYISSILGSGTSEMFPLVAESTLLTCG